MSLKPWIFVGTLLGLIVGGFLGYKLAQTPSPTHPPSPHNITLDVDRFDHKINVAPQQGEVVQWINQADATPVIVTFLTDSPCIESMPGSKCTVNVSQGNFQYTCPGCQDPGMDPRSLGGGPGGFLHRLDDLFHIGKTQDVLAAANPTDTAAQSARPKPHMDVVYAGIKCGPSGGAPTVIWDPNHPTDPFPVNVGQTIHWKAGSLSFQIGSFSIGTTPVSICQETTIDTTYPLCTVVKDPNHKPPYTVTYKVTTSGSNACSTPSGTASLAISAP